MIEKREGHIRKPIRFDSVLIGERCNILNSIFINNIAHFNTMDLNRANI